MVSAAAAVLLIILVAILSAGTICNLFINFLLVVPLIFLRELMHVLLSSPVALTAVDTFFLSNDDYDDNIVTLLVVAPIII